MDVDGLVAAQVGIEEGVGRGEAGGALDGGEDGAVQALLKGGVGAVDALRDKEGRLELVLDGLRGRGEAGGGSGGKGG